MARPCHSSLLRFPGLPWSFQPRKLPFISKTSWPICKCFAIAEGQEKPNLVSFVSAQQAFCPTPATLHQERFLGHCFVDQMYLVLTWSWSKHPPKLSLSTGSSKGWLHLASERSHTRNSTGMVPGFKTEKASYVDRLSTRDSWVLSFICFPRDTWQPALVRSLHFSTPLLPRLFHTNVRSALAVHGLLLPRGMLLQHLTQLQTSNRGASDNYFYIYRF